MQNPYGLYIHVPFCESICPYCDFSTWKAAERQHKRWLTTVLTELKTRCTPNTAFHTIYIGGGTPSLLSPELVGELFENLHAFLNLTEVQEISIEANPSRLNHRLLQVYSKWNISRVSVGVQSFDNAILKGLGRNHTAQEALDSLQLLSEFPFSLNLDLMFGTPHQNMEILKNDLKIAVQQPIHHLSLYGLTIEPNTLFHQQYQKKRLPPIQENSYDEMYLYSTQYLRQHGLEQYEVSNFAKPGHRSRHNSNYWNHTNYLGLGPGAHSLYNNTRSANSKKFATYEKWVFQGCRPENTFSELLTQDDRYTEFIWLNLRQTQGLSLNQLQEDFHHSIPIEKLQKWEKLNYIQVSDKNVVQLLNKGWLYLDAIASDLAV